VPGEAQSRLRDDELRRTYPEAVADPDVRLEKALGGEILAESSQGSSVFLISAEMIGAGRARGS
jgi:hypothetical protein